MANELKPWKYDIQYGPEGEANYAWVYDDQGVMVATMKTHKAKEIVERMNTRPATPVEGLETVRYEIIETLPSGSIRWQCTEHKLSANSIAVNNEHPSVVNALVHRSQAEAIIAAERAENDEAYELGKRDGYSEAAQEIDLKTGGDGEYRYCTDHDPERHTPDPASMIQRIVERFETLNTMESVSEINEWKRRANEAEANNEALTARVKELEELNDLFVRQYNEANDYGNEGHIRAEALETQLAAAKKALRNIAEDKDTPFRINVHALAALEDRP